MTDTVSQSRKILRDLKRGRTVTALDALRRYGCLRLSGRIYDLKREGHPITKTMVEVGEGKWVARYRLPKRKAA